MTSVFTKQPFLYANKVAATHKSKSGRSTFAVCVFLVEYMLFYYYYNLLAQTSDGEPVYIILILTAVSDLLIIALCVTDKSLDKVVTILFLSCLGFNTISYFVNRSGLHKLLMLAMVLSCTYLCIKKPLSRKQSIALFWVFVIAVIAILPNTALGHRSNTNQFNPNTGAFLMTTVFCGAFSILLHYQNNSFRKIVYAIICVLALIGGFVYASRTALIGIVLFGAAVFLLRGGKRTFKAKTVFCIMLLLAVMGILIAYLYADVLYSLLGGKSFVVFGKELFTGREEIWQYAFESIRSNFFFGVGNNLNEKYAVNDVVVMNAHNQPLGILAYFGVFVFVLFYIALAKIIALLYKDKAHKYNRIPAIYFSVILVTSYFEIYFMALYNLIPLLIMFAVIVGVGQRRRKAKQ